MQVDIYRQYWQRLHHGESNTELVKGGRCQEGAAVHSKRYSKLLHIRLAGCLAGRIAHGHLLLWSIVAVGAGQLHSLGKPEAAARSLDD